MLASIGAKTFVPSFLRHTHTTLTSSSPPSTHTTLTLSVSPPPLLPTQPQLHLSPVLLPALSPHTRPWTLLFTTLTLPPSYTTQLPFLLTTQPTTHNRTHNPQPYKTTLDGRDYHTKNLSQSVHFLRAPSKQSFVSSRSWTPRQRWRTATLSRRQIFMTHDVPHTVARFEKKNVNSSFGPPLPPSLTSRRTLNKFLRNVEDEHDTPLPGIMENAVYLAPNA